MKNLSSIIMIALCAINNGCKKEETTVVPAPPGNEFITTVAVHAINIADSTDSITAKWVDLTPGDLNPPNQIDTLKLKAGAIYNCTISFIDETKSPAEDITGEIRDRGNYHLLCFNFSGLNTFTITRTDFDTNNPPLPIGLSDRIETGTLASGNIEIQLRHQPNVKDGSCSTGSADVDITLPVLIY